MEPALRQSAARGKREKGVGRGGLGNRSGYQVPGRCNWTGKGPFKRGGAGANPGRGPGWPPDADW